MCGAVDEAPRLGHRTAGSRACLLRAGDELVLLILGGAGELVAREHPERCEQQQAGRERDEHQSSVNHTACIGWGHV